MYSKKATGDVNWFVVTLVILLALAVLIMAVVLSPLKDLLFGSIPLAFGGIR